MENGMADRKNVEDLEFLEVEDIEEASENIVNSYTSTDNSNSERIHNAGIAKNVEKYTEEDDSLTQERKNEEKEGRLSLNTINNSGIHETTIDWIFRLYKYTLRLCAMD